MSTEPYTDDRECVNAPDGKGRRVLAAMSGGVDSSVAVALLQERGYDCVGATMTLYATEGAGGEQTAVIDQRRGGQADTDVKSCGGSLDAADAARVAADLGIPHHLLDYRDDFREKVIDPFVRSYLAGETPNPCIRCNRYLKFDRLLAAAEELGCEKIATGHYARISRNGITGRWELRRAVDPKKDQSYVLYTLGQEQLARIEFPLGGLTKQDVREFARAHGFSNAEKGESQDICFIPDGDYEGFLRRRVSDGYPAEETARNGSGIEEKADGEGGEKSSGVACGLAPGNIVDEAGKVLGTHRGYIGYTIGQRRGLGLPSTEPWYVTAIRPETNEVVVGRRESAYGRELVAEGVNWLSIAAPASPFRAMAKVRYRHEAAPCAVTPLADGRVQVLFDEPQWAITRGQAVVFYDGDLVLGGGTIT